MRCPNMNMIVYLLHSIYCPLGNVNLDRFPIVYGLVHKNPSVFSVTRWWFSEGSWILDMHIHTRRGKQGGTGRIRQTFKKKWRTMSSPYSGLSVKVAVPISKWSVSSSGLIVDKVSRENCASISIPSTSSFSAASAARASPTCIILTN